MNSLSRNLYSFPKEQSQNKNLPPISILIDSLTSSGFPAHKKQLCYQKPIIYAHQQMRQEMEHKNIYILAHVSSLLSDCSNAINGKDENVEICEVVSLNRMVETNVTKLEEQLPKNQIYNLVQNLSQNELKAIPKLSENVSGSFKSLKASKDNNNHIQQMENTFEGPQSGISTIHTKDQQESEIESEMLVSPQNEITAQQIGKDSGMEGTIIKRSIRGEPSCVSRISKRSKRSKMSQIYKTKTKPQKAIKPMEVPEKKGKLCEHCRCTNELQWRRGPYGERSLCNACGIFFGKLLRILRNDWALAGKVMRKRRSEVTKDKALFRGKTSAEEIEMASNMQFPPSPSPSPSPSPDPEA